MSTPEHSQLGKASSYADQYDASLLFPIPRAEKRLELGIAGAPPFLGADLWTAFELSWLNARGKPQVALAHFTVPCETPNISLIHISEPTRRTPISYAVFCLKK